MVIILLYQDVLVSLLRLMNISPSQKQKKEKNLQMPHSQTQSWRHLYRHSNLHYHHHLPHTTVTWRGNSR